MTLSADSRGFLRDLALLLGLPALGISLLLAWWRPWDQLPYETHPASAPLFEAREAVEKRARSEGVHWVDWHGLRLQFPGQYVLTVREPTLELLERFPPQDSDNDHWSAQMAFLGLDSAATARFREAASNCDLAPDRCWREVAADHKFRCQRSAGVPDPEVPWTPHLECQVPEVGVRILINAPPTTATELLALFDTALAHPIAPDHGS